MLHNSTATVRFLASHQRWLPVSVSLWWCLVVTLLCPLAVVEQVLNTLPCVSALCLSSLENVYLRLLPTLESVAFVSSVLCLSRLSFWGSIPCGSRWPAWCRGDLGSDSPSFTSQALGLHMCAALPGLVVAYCWIVRIIYIFCIEISLSDVCCSNLANILPILINSFSHFPNLFFEPQSFHSDEIHDAPFICF